MFQKGDIVTCSCDPDERFEVVSSDPAYTTTVAGTGPAHSMQVRTAHLTLVEDWFEAWVSQIRADAGLT